MTLAMIFLALAGAAGLAALGLRLADARADRAERARLIAGQPAAPARFDPAMVADLPEPARRFFLFAIRPGTPLCPVAEIAMSGRFGLGDRARPGYRPMQARQVLAAPRGFVWAMRTRGGLPVSGSDSGRWTRFRILGLVPVARLGGSADHARSAYGRMVAEAVFWTPAAVLPGPGCDWQAAGRDRARVTLRHGAQEQSVEIELDAAGRPLRVVFDRWSKANPAKRWQLQPFGGALSDFREVSGYRLPHRVEAGNFFGTDAYFPFFDVTVDAIRFPASPGAADQPASTASASGSAP